MSVTVEEIHAMWPRDEYDDPWPTDGSWPDYCYLSGYQPIIARIVPDAFMCEEQDDYQGDTFVLGRDAQGRWVWLEFGWGSCSGCDALQSCSSMQEVLDLVDNMESSAKKWDHAAEALDWFQSHDWEGDWATDFKTASVKKAIAILEIEAAR